MNTLSDQLETDFGTAILEELTGQALTRNQQPVRLFDQSHQSAEFFYKFDKRGKPYIQDYQNSKRHYPVTAYCRVYDVDFATAVSDLCQQYYGHAVPEKLVRRPRRIEPLPPPRPVDYLPADYYDRCRRGFNRNGLYEYLCYTYGRRKADEVFDRYRLGTSHHWQYLGYLSTCLPQFDIVGNLRQIKIMPFDAMNGRRVKKHQQAEKWNSRSHRYESTAPDEDKTCFAGRSILRDVAGLTDVNLRQCFFGEHLLTKYPGNRVALVEGESTAIICSIIWPEYIWLATGGKNGARWTSPETFHVLEDRDVVLWPDNDALEDWTDKAAVLRPLVRSLNVSDYVRKNMPEGWTKADLRDLLTRPRLLSSAGQILCGESLPVEPGDASPEEWGTSIDCLPTENAFLKSRLEASIPMLGITYPRPPLRWDIVRSLEWVRWCIIPDGVAEADYNPALPKNHIGFSN